MSGAALKDRIVQLEVSHDEDFKEGAHNADMVLTFVHFPHLVDDDPEVVAAIKASAGDRELAATILTSKLFMDRLAEK